jgi:CelD/BcsL family acetyltransferase involved in cellulose biosynthesis
VARTPSPDAIGKYRIRELTTPAGIESIRELWDDLVARVAHRSFLHELPWSAAVCGQLLPGIVAYYCVYDGEKLIAVIPLERRSWGLGFLKLRWLQLPSHSNIFLGDIILDQAYHRESVFSAVLEHVDRVSSFHWDYCKLRKYCPRSSLYSLTRQEGMMTRQVGNCSYTLCRDGADAGRISRKMWKNVSRLARKAAQEIGPVSIACSEPGPACEGSYKDFLNIESSGWKGEGGSGTCLSADPESSDFFRCLMVDSADGWFARVFTLNFGEHKVASMLAIKSNAIWYLLKIGYEEEYRAYGPGSILLQAFIQRVAAEEDTNEINLTTAPLWAERWHFPSVPLYESLVFGSTLRARACRIYYSLKFRLRQREAGSGKALAHRCDSDN